MLTWGFDLSNDEKGRMKYTPGFAEWGFNALDSIVVIAFCDYNSNTVHVRIFEKDTCVTKRFCEVKMLDMNNDCCI